MPSFNKVHECFKFNGKHYNFNALNTLALNLIKSQASYARDIGDFLLQWQNKSITITLKTSGSTGTPKTIELKKQAMVNSAIATGLYFNLKPKNSTLLCLPAHYIAGKMMLVRAMVLGLEMDSIEPKSKLEIEREKHYNFAAMVPLQLENNIDKLQFIDKVIVGGAKVSSALNAKLQHLEATVFETYGMTETVSHIAVKQLNNYTNCTLEQGEKLYFKTLPNVSISQDQRQCLVITAPKVSEKQVITNDSVKLHSKTEFEWLGRIDNIINSGGVKVFPEQVENALSDKIKVPFFIASEADEILGERVILVVEGANLDLDVSIFNSLKAYSKPKKTYYLSKFIETSSGKIQRAKTLQLLKK